MKWCCVVLIINLFVLCSSEDVQLLKLTIMDTSAGGTGDLECSGDILYIELNKTYKIRIDYGGDCRFEYEMTRSGPLILNRNEENIHMHKGNGYYESASFTASELGSFNYLGVLYCECLDVYNGTCKYVEGSNMYDDPLVSCTTTINVFNPGEKINLPEASLAVNTQTFSTSGSEQDYYYHDGQGTMFTCTRTVGQQIQLSFTTSDERIASTNWQKRPSVNMYVKLTSSLNGTKLQCLVAGDTGYQRNITLNLMLAKQGLTAFRVNGLIPLLRYQSDVEYHYEYIFHDDEELTVKLIKDDDTTLDLPSLCYVEGSNIPYQVKHFFWHVVHQLIDQELKFPVSQGANGTELNCFVATTQPMKYIRYSISFIFHDIEHEPYFDDLSMSNILLFFVNNTGWQFEYEVDSTRDNSRICRQPHNGEVNGEQLLDYCHFIRSLSHGTKLAEIHPNVTSDSTNCFDLKPDQNEAVLKCAFSKYVRLVRKNTTTINPSKTSAMATEAPPVEKTPQNSNSLKLIYSRWFVASFVATVLVSAGGAMLVLCCYCRRKQVAALQTQQSPAMVAPSRPLWSNWTLFRSVRINTERTGEEAEITETTSTNYDYAYVNNVKRLVVGPHDNVESSDYDYISIRG